MPKQISPPEGNGWEVIDKAPKDGTRIDVWLSDASASDVKFYCQKGEGRKSDDWYWKNNAFRPFVVGNIISIFIRPSHFKLRPALEAG